MFSDFTMTRYFNIDIDNIITDYELSYQNTMENFIDEIKRNNDNILKVYAQKIDEYSQTLSMYLYYQLSYKF